MNVKRTEIAHLIEYTDHNVLILAEKKIYNARLQNLCLPCYNGEIRKEIFIVVEL